MKQGDLVRTDDGHLGRVSEIEYIDLVPVYVRVSLFCESTNTTTGYRIDRVHDAGIRCDHEATDKAKVPFDGTDLERARQLAISFGYDPQDATETDEKQLLRLAEALRVVRRQAIEECVKVCEQVRDYNQPSCPTDPSMPRDFVRQGAQGCVSAIHKLL